MFLVLDSPYLCRRAFHAIGHLSFNEDASGVLFGFLRDLRNLLEQFNTSDVVFCFDSGLSLRQEIYQKYKHKRIEKRKTMSEEEKATHRDLRRQIKRLRVEILPALGFRNIFSQAGYEADDLVAAFCEQTEEKVVIVSSDHDFLQLINERVVFWDARQKKAVTYQSFREEYGLEPSQWSDVKAIAGCHSDDVQGIKGIGEKTAVKFLTGKLNQDSSAYKKILAGNRIWKRNKELVTLPFPGLAPLKIRKDVVTRKKWREVLMTLGIESIRV